MNVVCQVKKIGQAEHIMRKVYTPPSVQVSWGLVILGAMIGTLCVFLVLPLTQMISSGAKRQLTLAPIDTALPPPPPIAEVAPPPQKPKDEVPPPELERESLPLTLSDLDLDVSAGMGGILGKGLDFGGEALKEVAIFDIADLDERPQAVARVSPKYPTELLRAGIEGSVVLLFVLDEKGKVEDVRVESSTRSEFERPALSAVRRWRFKPGTRNGRPVRSYVRQQLAFRLAQ